MTIAEILEAHKIKHGVRDSRTHCTCGWMSPSVKGGQAFHRAHIAEVLDKHMRGREAVALEEAANDSQMGPVPHGWNASGIASWLRDRAEQIREVEA